MNKVIISGRLCADPDIRYSQGEEATCIARYRLAVDRPFNRDETDFINCVAFGKRGEFVEKYLAKGTKIMVSGRIQTGSYTNRDGQKVYTTDVVVDEHEFCESKSDQAMVQNTQEAPAGPAPNGFMHIPDGIDEELPFN